MFGVLGMSNSVAQESNAANFLSVLDKHVSKMDTELFRGELYVEKHPVRNDNHKFFGEGTFSLGSILFDDQKYYDVNLKYDVYGDQVLIHHEQLPMSMVIQLDNARVHQFSLDNRVFVNTSFTTNNKEEISGFIETLYEGEMLQVYKKHVKKIYRRLEGKLFYEFKNDANYYVNYNDEYYELKNLKSLRKILVAHKSKTQELINKYKRSGAPNFEQKLINIISDLDTHLITLRR